MSERGVGRQSFHWCSNIAWKDKARIVVRGYDVNELASNLDFGQMLFVVLRGELPSPAQARITNAMMVSLAEHALSPSSATARFATAGGAELNAAVSAGVAAIGRLHGTADRPAVMFRAVRERAAAEHAPLERAAAATVREMRSRRERMPGFHHAQHVRDPRTATLLGLSDSLGISSTHVAIARAMEDATEEAFGRRIWLNGPGAMGCIGRDAGYEPLELKAMFIVARSLSLAAHSIEESATEKGWRASENTEMVQPLALEMQGPDWYRGPADRSLPPELRRGR
jgi:citrate synthase